MHKRENIFCVKTANIVNTVNTLSDSTDRNNILIILMDCLLPVQS